MMHETKMEIDLKKLKSNTEALCNSYSDYKYKFADLKDNGHGLGLNIIDTMEQFGINYSLVGSLKDALEIRKFNRSIPVLVNYNITLEEVYDCINNNITITIYSLDFLKKLIDLKIKDTLKVHILIDNGSNLMGVKNAKELGSIVDLIAKDKNIVLEGIYTELTTLGVLDEFYYKQVDNFYHIINKYINNDLIVHLNEPIMYHEKNSFISGIRFDLSILGIEENINDDIVTNMKIKTIEKKHGNLEFPLIDLQLVFNITSVVMSTRFVKKGDIVGRNYIAKNDMNVAIIPIGHKDGITKAINYVGIKNYKRSILTDEIDHIIVEVTEDVKVNDKVYIVNEERGIYDFLTTLKTNRYYLMSVLNRNLNRVYINKEEKGGNIL